MATAVKTDVQLKHEDIKPLIGSRVLNSKEELLSGALANDIRELLEARGVLVFPKIDFSDEEQIAFTKTLGTFAPEMSSEGREEIHKVTLDVKENPSSALYLKGSLYWHIDGTMNEVPILASLLSCKVPATWGGNTGFCNTYAAFDALDEDKKAEYRQYRARHGAWASLFYYDPEPSLALLQGMQKIGDNELPLVWKHESGRESLVIGCTTHTVVGKDPMESAVIIHGLREWATQEQFSYSHEWSVGDMVMWDNTGTMHRAEAYDPTCGRMMHRTKLQGEEPFE
ncbi:TauD/TfdA dioxygenase family protein [Stakelama tenebrarum]|uniref:TauD/TfdA family dioxygenase n=1 Tax=Stakelama tenebrarum TaxID=2711215 RepID=A0A6G6Y785_9SPHN|nr:TauD/TfdA family dioxygenase [Sphingosinithalassobacter tenebrarum]QIG80802.1 TauD/TfdA family dioxygenase [Sphingosinithalassobacter tenebrarum]